MIDQNCSVGAHPSFPISASALQGASLRPDSIYFDITIARQLSATLGETAPFFSAGELSAIGLLGKIYLSVIETFLTNNSGVFLEMDQFLVDNLSLATTQAALSAILKHYPTALSFQDPNQENRYLFSESSSTTARHSYYGSLFLIYLAENNQAIKARDGFFTDPVLRRSPHTTSFFHSFQTFFSGLPEQEGSGLNFLDTLLEPLRLHPNSLFDQLSYIRRNWGDLVDHNLLHALLIPLGHIKEEYNTRTAAFTSIAGDPLGFLTSTAPASPEPVMFSPDGDWMPRVVLQAKNVYVWLDQLSKQYQSPIIHLDDIPDEELFNLSNSGITALWLIGLWERSPASQTIKQLCGNPQAVSSAYSLYDYTISDRLGGEEAYQGLSSKAAQFNLKLAADMVPNHMGIDSRWVSEHPDWFLSRDKAPFPAYTFTGVDLSSNPSVGIFLEDHYYDKTDASVVFKRTDNQSGGNLYIYHGNDGTSMPWNDTAQLDFLNPEVREGVIQTILHVARKFPIIRFDAAMTLSKKHFQRLWFPEPGTGGAIPTRTEFGMSKEDFSSRMPVEFWREVVDRVAVEAPDTLLLAEAFWMMEGYFVRNLGMHRVYNSAFMHMLRNEDNDKYRQLIISTLELDPQILKRYVNFMNNPDEDTAISQFGSDGKYFGTCLMMSTLPGLPMFGHGQIEGFKEKYGMEYQKAYYDESPDPVLVERHKAEIFPLLHKRYLFADVENFYLYDLVSDNGRINPDVYAYSNRFDNESALIVFHNKWGSANGRIFRSAAINESSVDLLDGLGLSSVSGDFLLFTDQVSGLEYLRPLKDIDEHGLRFELGAYQYHAFVNFLPVFDPDGIYRNLYDRLGERGVSDLEMFSKEMSFEPLAKDLADLLGQLYSGKDELPPFPISEFLKSFQDLVPGIFSDLEASTDQTKKKLTLLLQVIKQHQFDLFSEIFHILIPWVLLSAASINQLASDLYLFINKYTLACQESVPDLSGSPERQVRDLSFLFSYRPQLSGLSLDFADHIDGWLSSSLVRNYLNVHDYQNRTYFEQESMETLLSITFAHFILEEHENLQDGAHQNTDLLNQITAKYKRSRSVLLESDYILDNFIAQLKSAYGG